MRFLVTGGAGFIASNLAIELEVQGHDVVIADNFFTGVKDNLKEFNGKILDVDVSRQFRIEGKFDAIFHEAAITDPRFEDDDEMMRANINGFKNMIELAIKNNAKLIYASSASVYGNGPVLMKEDQKKELLSAYAKSKLMMDEHSIQYFNKMHIVGLRYFNVLDQKKHTKEDLQA